VTSERRLESIVTPPSDGAGDEEDSEELVNALMDEVSELNFGANERSNVTLATVLLKARGFITKV
jgi:hypothetical protein